MRAVSKDTGFTLIETLVAVFSLALMMAAGGTLIISTLDTQKLIDERMSRLEAMELVTAHLQSDLANAVPRLIGDEYARNIVQSFYGGEADRDGVVLGLVRDGWQNAQYTENRSGLLPVRYRFEDGKLMRQIDVRPDRTRRTPEFEKTLLDGINEIDVRFMAAGQPASNWGLALEGGVPRLPDSVEVIIVFNTGERLSQSFLVGGRL